MSNKYFKFIDYVELPFKAGQGGEGSSSRIKVGAHPMNIGGDGGNGGDVYVECDRHIYDLHAYSNQQPIKAAKGDPGDSYRKKGAMGEHAYIHVPMGTLVKNQYGDLLVDMVEDKQKYTLAKGGRGGEGNFKKDCTIPPYEGEKGRVLLDYRLMIDAVLIGPPNSGKTAFLKYATKNPVFEPKHYPYATWHPVWAAAEYNWRQYTVMEMPALAGKPEEVEKTFKYLRHMYRAKVVIYFMDATSEKWDEEMAQIKANLAEHVPLELEKPFIIVANKCDIQKVEKPGVLNISTETGEGMNTLSSQIMKYVYEEQKSSS